MTESRQSELEVQLRTLISAKGPSFIFIRDLSLAHVARSTLKSVLAALRSESENLIFSFVDCVACFTPRLLFDSIVNGLLDDFPDSDSKIDTFSELKNDNVDDFCHNIRILFPTAKLSSACPGVIQHGYDELKIVVALERTEKLRVVLPGLIYPLSRLQELTKSNVTTIFMSEDTWENITPIPGTLTDPYVVQVDALGRQETIGVICDAFPSDVSPDSTSIYNPSLETLFRHFVEAVYDVCSPFVSDATELGYIVAVRWPGFVAPILKEWQEQEGPYMPPTEDVRIRLIRLFNPSLMNAVETLYPRVMERKEWSAANSFPANFRLNVSRNAQLPSATYPEIDATDLISKLSGLSMFILLAAFLASYNPAKTDLRMFGRLIDEKSRRRRKGGATRKTKQGTAAKLPQRLVGPMTFPYDRLVAILGSLLREYGDMKQAVQSFDDAAELKVESEVYRVQTSASIRELMSMHLLHRATINEKLESMSLRCGIEYDQALLIARKLDIPLADLMWEPN